MDWYRNHPLTRRSALAVFGAAGALTLAGCAAATSDGSASSALSASDTPESGSDSSSAASASASASEQVQPIDPIADLVNSMTLEQKVAQLFFVTPEELTGVQDATIAGDLTRDALASIPVGGVVYFSRNIVGNQQLRDLVSGTVSLSKAAGAQIPVFTGVDEEGGTLVARVANSGYFDVDQFPDMAQIGASGDPAQAARVGTAIGSYLNDIGFSVDFAPDADVLTNPDNTVIGVRSFGSDPQVVSEMVSAEVAAMLTTRTLPCAKHFPGHGDTAGDSHTGEAVSNRSTEQLEQCEYLPFKAAVEAACPLIMVGHIETPNAAADGLPASLSQKMITEVLRNEIGFTGVVISDSMGMGAITQYYEPADAAVRFLQAGGDMILMPPDLEAAYQGVLDAVSAGTLTADRIDESVHRILLAKQVAGLI